ncbi:MAG: flagellar hook-basal body complex protein FliE [Planctomycetales bacterium]|nr:flagellar hook-basal body complex protein FliE [Planctomycetales bacterium]
MTIQPTQLPPQFAALIQPGTTGAAAGAGATNTPAAFGQLMTELLGEVNQQQLDADDLALQLSTGKTDSVQDVVLSAVKADLSVRMLIEIRNQLVQTYQEVMRMQL